MSEDDPVTAQTAARGILAVLPRAAKSSLDAESAVTWQNLSEQLNQAASGLILPRDLDQARLQFDRISQQMLILAQKFGIKEQSIFRFHCPMAFDNKGADWLQNHKDLANPYFGSMMLGCGSEVALLDE